MSQYGAVAAKIHGMRSRLLKNEDYARLAASSSVKEIISYLKSHPGYEKALADVNPESVRRETFERLLVRSVMIDIKKISYFLDRKQKSFLKVYNTIFELRFINDVIREIFNKYSDPVDLSVYGFLFESSSNFNFNQVIAASTIEELIEALEGSIYLDPVKRTHDSIENAGVFDYETALNRFYFYNFWNELNKFNSRYDRKVLLEVHGIEIDMLNILWIYRTKAHYNVKPQNMYKYLIPAYHDLKVGQVAQMVSAGNVDELMNVVATTKYGRRINLQDPSSLEKTYHELVKKTNIKNTKKHPYSFAVIEGYITQKRAEIYKLVRITESVRYGYDSKTIMDVLDLWR